jgi:carbon storage regulator CsrA
MLALSRKPGEAVKITTPDGVDVVVHVISVKGRVVRLGFETQRDVSIYRTELLGRGSDAADRETPDANDDHAEYDPEIG